MRNQSQKRFGKVRLRDLLKRLVDLDGLGWPSRMHDDAAAAGIAAIAFADADDRIVIGVDDGSGMHLQFTGGVCSPT